MHVFIGNSVSQCSVKKTFKIELSGINERILPRRPELLLSLFVKMSVFTAALLAWHGACQHLLGPTGNSQAFPPAWLGEKSTHSTHPCMLKSSASWKKTLRKLRSMCARASLMLITPFRNDASHPGKCLKRDIMKKRERKGLPSKWYFIYFFFFYICHNTFSSW